MCAPTQCDGDIAQTGAAQCVDGTWICTTVGCSCPEVCSTGGIIVPGCNADFPPEFCDLGNGHCVLGPCPGDVDAGAACTKGSISAASFNQSCSTDADCVAIAEGSLCGPCFCPNAAINQGALPAYDGALQDAGPPVSTCSCPIIPSPVCTGPGAADGGGVCTLP
jgi:hypothetical protein